MTDQVGRTLTGRYKIIEKLSEGGFGHTFKAKDLHFVNHPICVVKQLKPKFTTQEELNYAVDKFFQEAETLHRLGEHPQIPRLLAYFKEQDNFYLVQEYIQGHTLDQEIICGQPLPEEKVIDILKQILGILVFVHDNEVIHRDIKPQNIIRRADDNKLVLIDFGLVKAVTSEQDPMSIFIVGTPPYISIEQGIGKPDYRTDVYALGVIAIEALKGDRLDPTVPSGVLSRSSTGEIIWKKEDSWSPGLDKIIRVMVHPNLQKRFSAQEALQAINDLYKSQTSVDQFSSKWVWRVGLIFSIFIVVLLGKAVINPGSKLRLNGPEIQGTFTSTDVISPPTNILDSTPKNTKELIVRRYLLSGKKYQAITIEMDSDQIDCSLTLLAPDRKLIRENDDISSSNHNAKITVTLPTDGEYVVQAQSSQGELGHYRLRATAQN